MLGFEIAIELEDHSVDEALDAVALALSDLETGGFEVREESDRLVVVVAPAGTGTLDHPQLVSALRGQGLPVGEVRPHRYDDVDWSTQWRHHFQPLRVGRLDVLPSWVDRPADAGEVLWLDPSMAFGTGLHPSTRLCLRRMESMAPPSRLLDVGTGSGILALAALRLGTEASHAVDIDPEAIRVARENAERNQLQERLTLEVSGDPAVSVNASRFPCVVANILAEPLIAMAPRLASRVEPGGTLLLSGLLDRQAAAVTAAFEQTGLRRVGDLVDGEWILLEFRREA
jgi:ribosomal protein L11 methyltransferase